MLWFVKPLLVTGILRQTFKQYRLQLVLMYMAWANWKKYVHTSYTSLYTIEKWNVLSFHCTSTFSSCTLQQSYLVCTVNDIVFWTKCTLHLAFVQCSCNTGICETLSKWLFNPFRSYIGPRPTVWFFLFRSDVGRRPTRFLLCMFAHCRNLSDAFPHVVRALANR